MKMKKKLTAVVLLIAMIFSNLIFPLQGIVYAAENKTINFIGNNLVVNGNGSVSFDWWFQGDKSTLTFTLYDAENQIVAAEPMVVWDEGQQMNVPTGTEAWIDLQTTSYEGFYFIVTSDNVNVQELKFDIAGRYEFVDETGRLNLPTDVEHININYYDIRSINEPKEIYFQSENLQLNQDGSVDVDCTIEYNTGMIRMYLYNSEGELVIPEHTTRWNEATSQNEICEHEVRAVLDKPTYEGSYLILSSVSNVNLDDVKIEFPGPESPIECLIGENGRVDLPDVDHLSISEHIFENLTEKKQVFFHSEDYLNINGDGSVTLEYNVEGDVGRITVTAYNYDGSKINIRNYDKWNEELQQWGVDTENAFGNVNGTTYAGAYLMVTSNDFNLSEYKFRFSGVDEGIDCFIGENGRVNVDGCEFVHLDEHSFVPLYEKKRVEFRSDTLVFNQDGTVTMDSEIEGNEGQLTFEVRNSDGTKAIINQSTMYNDETQQEEPDPRRGEARLNKTTFEGAYLIVTANNVDLTDFVIDMSGNQLEVGQNGRVDLPTNTDWISIEPWAFREKYTKKEVSFSFDNIQINNGILTAPCTLKNNTGSINFELHNSDGSKANIKKCIFYDWETDQNYESENDGYAKLNTTTYEGAYFILSSNDVDLDNIRLVLSGRELQIVKDGNTYKANLGEADHLYMDRYSIKALNPEKVNVTVNVTTTNGKLEYIEINDELFLDGEKTNSVNLTKEVEEREEDRIIICLEAGKIVTTIRVNDQQADITEECKGYLDFEVPHTDTYEIEITCAKDPNYLPSIEWFTNEGVSGELFKNGTIEIVSVKLADGQTVYDHDELLPVDDPGIGPHPQHEEAYLREEPEYGYGALYAQEGSTVTLKIIPDEGYEVSKLTLDGGLQLVKDPNVENQYTVVMPESGTYRIGEIITEKQDKYTGLKQVEGTWYYYKDGVVDTEYTGLVEHNNKWYYVQNGVLNWGVETLVKYGGTWYYVKNSTLDWNYTGLCKYGSTWYYIQKGTLKWGVETLVQYGGTWYYVKNSTLDWNFTGLFKYGNTTYYIQKGTLKWGVKTLVQDSDKTWYYLDNSKVDFNYTGLVKYGNTWYYIQKGILSWGANTLVKYSGTWYYVKNSTLDWNYTGLFKYSGSWYYIQKGTLKWGVETLVKYNGTWYYVKNSTLDWNFTGLCKYGSSTYYIQKGTLKWGYNGKITYNGKQYNIKNSTVV